MGRAVAVADERRTRDEAAKAVAKSKRGPRVGLPILPAPARREQDATRSHKYPDEQDDDEARRAKKAEAAAAAEG
jgi:hypothetical protein